MVAKIKFPDRVQVEDKIYIPTGEFRQAKKGETYWDPASKKICVFSRDESAYKYPIFKLKRWRASQGRPFYYVSDAGRVCIGREFFNYKCNELHEVGNYFLTRDEAVEIAPKIQKIYKSIKG